MEPLMSISLEIHDPSMRALASAAWTFSKDICFVFLKLKATECRWYEGDTDIDELVYLAASKAATDQGNPFVIAKFYNALHAQLRSANLSRLASNQYENHFLKTLLRYTQKTGAQYVLKGDSPYDFMNHEEDAELRLREYAPLVLEELGADGQGFSFEDYVLRLSTYLENGSRKIVERLKAVNPLISEFAELMTYTKLDEETGKERLYLKEYLPPEIDANKTSLYNMDPYDFERLIADYFVKRGYVKAETIGGSGDRGVDVLVTNLHGDYEMIQCKRYRMGSNIGSTPIQRVDSMRFSRGAVKAWVFTTSDFTPDGIDEARITGVNLMNGDELIRSLNLYYPGKYCL
jgi:restriction system protein